MSVRRVALRRPKPVEDGGSGGKPVRLLTGMRHDGGLFGIKITGDIDIIIGGKTNPH